MGFFSWITSDTNKSISNAYTKRGALPVYLLIPKEFGGGAIYEDDYEGYGEFGGEDAYDLLAQWNAPEKCTGDVEHDRLVGIDLAYGDEPVKYPLKFVETEVPYETVQASADCPDQGYFY